MKLSERLDWLDEVQRIMTGDTVALAVAVALQRRENHKTGRLNPSYETITRDCGFDHRDTARRAVKRLRDAGLVEYRETYGGNRQNTNHYTLTRCSGAPGADKHPVLSTPSDPVLHSTTEPVGEPRDDREPLGAVSRSPNKREKLPPVVPTKKEREAALANLAEIRKQMAASR